jgi:hypothetical protein
MPKGTLPVGDDTAPVMTRMELRTTRLLRLVSAVTNETYSDLVFRLLTKEMKALPKSAFGVPRPPRPGRPPRMV